MQHLLSNGSGGNTCLILHEPCALRSSPRSLGLALARKNKTSTEASNRRTSAAQEHASAHPKQQGLYLSRDSCCDRALPSSSTASTAFRTPRLTVPDTVSGTCPTRSVSGFVWLNFAATFSVSVGVCSCVGSSQTTRPTFSCIRTQTLYKDESCSAPQAPMHTCLVPNIPLWRGTQDCFEGL